MTGINKVFLIGHLGKDPLHKKLPNGDSVVTFPLATDEWIIKSGAKVEITEWHNIIMWKTMADSAAHMLKKNTLVHIEGKLTTRSFTDNNGNKRYLTEVQVSKFTTLYTYTVPGEILLETKSSVGLIK